MIQLVLFDIDSTIMNTGGAGRRAMERAFGELYGIRNAFDGIVPDGNTDPLIFREILKLRLGKIVDEDSAVAAITERYLHYLGDEMPKSEDARLMPGVRDVLQRLAATTEMPCGLLTGNLEAGARTKLSHFDLNRFFAFGAFSSDDELRSNLVPIAVARAEASTGRSIGVGPQVAVVGDSPLDVACALAHSATAVGVATGRYGVEELSRSGAHLTFESLAETEGVLCALGVG